MCDVRYAISVASRSPKFPKVGILRAPFELYVQQCSYLNIYLQEPGVYMVFVTAILQDACLSIKVASNLAEREVPDSQPFLL